MPLVLSPRSAGSALPAPQLQQCLELRQMIEIARPPSRALSHLRSEAAATAVKGHPGARSLRASENGLSQGELAELLGGRSRLSEFMTGGHELSKTQIRALRDELGIPADLLIG